VQATQQSGKPARGRESRHLDPERVTEADHDGHVPGRDEEMHFQRDTLDSGATYSGGRKVAAPTPESPQAAQIRTRRQRPGRAGPRRRPRGSPAGMTRPSPDAWGRERDAAGQRWRPRRAVLVPAGALARGCGWGRWRACPRHDLSVGPACCATAWLSREPSSWRDTSITRCRWWCGARPARGGRRCRVAGCRRPRPPRRPRA